jgi:hypothetical protein
MSMWIITTDPETETPETVWCFEGTKSEASSRLSEKSSDKGKPLYIWKLEGHTELDIDVSVVPDDGE